ncbi:fibroblast growth factor receptor 2-like [Actinia tenebrosa]|uniref:Fibroblast growth factor receptor 2-like n=1 Tax=Actinia tenebrosa TaxID=6105 RepID=A0A6P8I0L9_ACTTE|nr:fibroblast growth factor receptor 2-like [Actinia tenebrosa]
MTFQVTPFFEREFIVGEKKEIIISKSSLPNTTNAKSTQLTPGERAGLIIGILLLLLLAILLIIWFVKRRQKLLKEGLLVGANGALIDHWEVPIDKICLEEELGEGAFGKVFKGMLVELPEQSAKYSIAKSIRRKSIKPLYPEDGYVVAIKMLHDFADIDQRKEFLKEIQLMKDVGAHRNIVNMLGCGTVCEPMFLIVEYLHNGDLLHYLRKRRGKAMQYPESDPRGPYHSTYCQTYFNKNNPDGGISLQPSRSDRVYVHTPEPHKESKNEDIKLISVQKNENVERGDGVGNPGLDHQPDNNGEGDIKVQQEDEDDILTSGDLMAFAWQVSQGMEYLSKRGYVHRDLAARNVLVGNSKEAKIADFGLTRHMYEDLYQAKTNRKLPLKWMSIEAIFDQSFTSQSDVWAYGVFLWELVTLGGTPYPSINNRELLKLLKEGYRMEKPETCDTELYNIMCSCWKEMPEDRPTFVDLREKLEEMMTRDNPYFDPTAVDESRDYYNVPSFNSAPEPGEDDDITEVIIGEASSPRDEIKDANKNTINSPDNNKNSQSVEDNTKVETLTFENPSFNDNDPDLNLDQVVFDNDNTARFKADQKNLKYARLDFEDIEFQLYRKQNHGLVL